MTNVREDRQQVRLAAQLRCGTDWRRIAITNVSTSGLRCHCSNPPALGAIVEVRHRGFSIVGSVQWCDQDDFGVTCEDTVDVELLVAGSPEVDIGRRAHQRLEVRFPAEFVSSDRSFGVVVHDISPSGARLAMTSPPPRGKLGTIKWDNIECECTVLWSGNNMFGVIFGNVLPAEAQPASRPLDSAVSPPCDVPAQSRADGSESAIANKIEERREKRRISVDWTCEVHHANSQWARVHLSNISTDGCVIGWFAGCRAELPLYIKLPTLSPVKADVVWKTNQGIGCIFSEPLNGWILEHLLAQRAA